MSVSPIHSYAWTPMFVTTIHVVLYVYVESYVCTPMYALLYLHSYVCNHYMWSPISVSPIRESPMYVILCLWQLWLNPMSVSPIYGVLCLNSYVYTPMSVLLCLLPLCGVLYLCYHYMWSPISVSPIRESPMYVFLCMWQLWLNPMSVSSIYVILCLYSYVCTPMFVLLCL